MKKLIYFFAALILLTSCFEDTNTYENTFYYSLIGTVSNPDSANVFTLNMDDSTSIDISETLLPDYYPLTGDRIIADLKIMTAGKDSAVISSVSLYGVYKILTKGIFNVTPEAQDSIGNDPITINDIWMGGGYLNVEFSYPGSTKSHYINLVSDTSKTYTDGKIHLEFRHNANEDYPQYDKWGVVSFNLNSLQSDTASTAELVIETKEYYYGDRSYNFTYNWVNTASNVIQKINKSSSIADFH